MKACPNLPPETVISIIIRVHLDIQKVQLRLGTSAGLFTPTVARAIARDMVKAADLAEEGNGLGSVYHEQHS